MNHRTANIILRETAIIFAILSLPFLFDKIGYVNLDLPFGKVNFNNVPKYSIAAKDNSAVIFENNIIFLFKQSPTKDEIIKAYTSKGGSLVGKSLYPFDTYKNFWIFHLNTTFGFIGIEFDKLGHWLLFASYPLYWFIRVIIWLTKALHEIFAGPGPNKKKGSCLTIS